MCSDIIDSRSRLRRIAAQKEEIMPTFETTDQFDERTEIALPCVGNVNCKDRSDTIIDYHAKECPAFYRAAVAAFARECTEEARAEALEAVADIAAARELLPCPFCGDPYPVVIHRRQSWIVGCMKCPGSVEDIAGQEGQEGREVAIKRWNRRASAPSPGVTTLIAEALSAPEDQAGYYIGVLCEVLERTEAARAICRACQKELDNEVGIHDDCLLLEAVEEGIRRGIYNDH